MPTKITKDGLEMVQQYGLGLFMAVVVLIVMLILIRYILKSNDKREERSDLREERLTAIINTGMLNLNASAQSLSQAIQTLQQQQQAAITAGQDRYNSMMGAAGHQRSEHTLMTEKLVALTAQAEVIGQHVVAINAKMDDMECKAK